MASIDMCEHDWPGSGCKECFPDNTSPQEPAMQTDDGSHSGGQPVEGGLVAKLRTIAKFGTKSFNHADADIVADAADALKAFGGGVEAELATVERAKAYARSGLDFLQYEIEAVIFRRVLEKRIDGYTLETAKELAATARASIAALKEPT